MDRRTFTTEAHKLVLKISLDERIKILLDAQEIAVACIYINKPTATTAADRKARIARQREKAYYRLIEKLLVDCGFDMDMPMRMYIELKDELIYIQDLDHITDSPF